MAVRVGDHNMPRLSLRRDIEAHLLLADLFVHRARQVADTAGLRSLLDDFCNEIGFRHFAVIHHDDLRHEKPGLINLQNYPDVWADHFIQQRLYLEDPVVHACLRTNAGFSWSELPRLLPMTPRYHEIMRQAGREGLSHGLTVPACVPGEPTGSCTLAGPRRGVRVERFLAVAQLVGVFSFQAARRLVSGNALMVPARRRLAPRQRECLVLVGQGKSDWEIGQILGLSRITVKHYLDAARARYDVATRTQLVIGALLDGEISMIELLPRQYVHKDA
jgi:LuxR family quorum-sensing system transcriptional regulator CciR